MASIDVNNLTIEFPVIGAHGSSLKRHVANLAVGGLVGRRGQSHQPIVRALSKVSFSLRSGDRLGLIGPNGAGKTTLLRCLAGVYHPDGGMIRVEGKIASLIDMSMGIDPFATGYENIRLRGVLGGLTNAQIKAKVDDVADFCGLGPFLAMPIKTYSQGMLARLMFSVATLVDPDVLLMDEWLSVGDAEFRWQAHQRLMDIFHRSNVVVLATHDTSIIKSLCNKFLSIESGAVSPVLPIDQLGKYVKSYN